MSEIEYLGVVFTNTGKFERASKSAVSKASFASYKIRSVLHRSGVDSVKARSALYDSFVRSTLLYGAEVWALQQEDLLERCQTDFLKSLYYLPKSTPGYVIRREFGVGNVIVEVLGRAIRWFQKIMAMDDKRLPRICLEKQLGSVEECPAVYNWASQLRNLFVKANVPSSWGYLLSGCLSDEAVCETLQGLRRFFESEDESRILNSSFCPLYKYFIQSDREFFNSISLSIAKSRVFYQIITSNASFQYLYCSGVSHRFSPLSCCLLCNQDYDTIEHFLLLCPCLANCRSFSGIKTPSSGTIAERVASLISVRSEAEMAAVWRFLVDALETRRFMERMLE